MVAVPTLSNTAGTSTSMPPLLQPEFDCFGCGDCSPLLEQCCKPPTPACCLFLTPLFFPARWALGDPRLNILDPDLDTLLVREADYCPVSNHYLPTSQAFIGWWLVHLPWGAIAPESERSCTSVRHTFGSLRFFRLAYQALAALQSWDAVL